MSPPERHPWFPLRRPRPAPRLRLFCLPHAGGGAQSYRAWPTALPPEVEVVALQPPGREGRLMEPGHERMEPLVREMADAVLPLLDCPYAIFGHSLGALTAYELVRLLRREGRPLPVHLMVSGRHAPHIPFSRRMHQMSDQEFIAQLRRLGGTPEAVLENEELLALLLPPLRRDFAIVETYTHAPEPPLDVPLTAFGGEQDEDVPRDAIEAWAAHTSGPFQARLFPGGHFYLHQPGSRLLPTVAAALAEHLAHPRDLLPRTA